MIAAKTKVPAVAGTRYNIISLVNLSFLCFLSSFLFRSSFFLSSFFLCCHVFEFKMVSKKTYRQ